MECVVGPLVNGPTVVLSAGDGFDLQPVARMKQVNRAITIDVLFSHIFSIAIALILSQEPWSNRAPVT